MNVHMECEGDELEVEVRRLTMSRKLVLTIERWEPGHMKDDGKWHPSHGDAVTFYVLPEKARAIAETITRKLDELEVVAS